MPIGPTGKSTSILTLPRVDSGGACPFLMINMAMTADGKIATANRACSSFGSREDMRNLMLLRAQADAVMAGARTIDSNPVTLGPGTEEYRKRRLKAGLAEYNIRVIVSGSASINPEAEIFKHPQSPLILFTTGQAPSARLQKLAGLVDEILICGKEEIDFRAALRWLREKWNVKQLVCEGGGELNSALFAQQVVKELHLTICPFIFGGGVAPTIADGVGVDELGQAIRLSLKSFRKLGEELFLVYEVAGE